MPEDKIISALIGLIRACDNNPETPNTAAIVLCALAFQGDDDRAVQETVETIRKEKFAVSPGCATCAMPCGNTSDYDMARIYNAEENIKKLKLDIIARLRKAARSMDPARLSPEGRETVFKALSYISFDLGEETLRALCDEVRAL